MTVGRALLAALFIVAGAMHFVATPVYVRIMPPYLPDPVLLVRVSGLCEALGGLGLLFEPTRRVAAWGLVALLIAVFPANVQMIADHAAKWRGIPLWVLWARLPLQAPVIWWCWIYTRD